MKTQELNPSPSVIPDLPRVELPVVPTEGGGLSSSREECDCSCCGKSIPAGVNRVANPKRLRILSRKVNGQLTGQICIPCINRIKGTRDWSISRGVSVLTSTIKKIEDGDIPYNIADIFSDLSSTKDTLEEKVSKQIAILDKLTAEYAAIQSAWTSVRCAYVNHLWATYPERRKRANAAISRGEIRLMVFSRDDFQCKWCGSGKKLQIDHIVPVVLGGDDEIENLQTLCQLCNLKKGRKLQHKTPAAILTPVTI